MKHLKYLKYVIIHKFFVMIECFRNGLYYRGLAHDMSKFRLSEWFPYVNFFYGETAKPRRDSTGYYKPTDTGDKKFDFSWLLHQKRNDHHWQYWILPEDDGGLKVLEMSNNAVLEMLCDWYGASVAQGNGKWDGVLKWYWANVHKMRLHSRTKKFVELYLKSKQLD